MGPRKDGAQTRPAKESQARRRIRSRLHRHQVGGAGFELGPSSQLSCHFFQEACSDLVRLSWGPSSLVNPLARGPGGTCHTVL